LNDPLHRFPAKRAHLRTQSRDLYPSQFGADHPSVINLAKP
jgi:hypothetical protein